MTADIQTSHHARVSRGSSPMRGLYLEEIMETGRNRLRNLVGGGRMIRDGELCRKRSYQCKKL